MYGCDFGWGPPLAPRSGRANKFDGKASLYPGREGGGSIDAEVVLTPEHMALLEQDDEFWAAVSADKPCPPAVGEELTAHGRSMSDRQQKESICL
jgi:hypothetical protein